MKKRLLYAASVAAIALTACTSEEYLGGVESQGANTVIGFSSETKSVTRAQATGSTAAEKLNNNFIVYGFKTNAATEAADGSTDQMVFNHYNVNYEAGTAYTTESNTAGWEYVSFANHGHDATSNLDEVKTVNPQTIKYWDHSAKNYVFSAVSGTGITATKTTTGTSVYDKGWKVEIPAGGSLGDLYASDRKVVAPGDYNKQVDLTFRALVSKVRFAIYETVPGYSVKINRFWFEDEGAKKYSDTNFEIKGNFKTANASTTTPLTITYYNAESGIENRPKVTFEPGDVTAKTYGEFGANIQAKEAIGTTSAEATYDQSDKGYTMILPYESKLEETPAENVLKLKVNYTLTSTDGSEETITVYGATAYVPTEYTQWKPNYAYTYIFKISDKTNGTTHKPTNPDDPEDYPKDPDEPGYDPTDPTNPFVGLSPITFDAVVITDETDVQETITTVAEPSITTYAPGVIVTENNEYVAGTGKYIYITTMMNGELVSDLATNAKLYEVHNTGTIEPIITEAVTENYLHNFCTLTPVTTDCTITDVPCNDDATDNTVMTFTAGQVMKFEPQAGKIYAFEYSYKTVAQTVAGYNAAMGTSIDQDAFDALTDEQKAVPGKVYKVIKIATQPETDPGYTFAASDASITATTGTSVLTLEQDGEAVLGAVPNFKITSENGNNALKIVDGADAGKYTVSIDPAAIAAGKANDTYTVTFGTKTATITVNIAYILRNAADDADVTAVTITAGNTTGATVINKIAGAAADGDVTEVPTGITVEKTDAGTYKITAAATLANGAYTVKIANQSLTVNVDNYSFLSDLVITKALTGTSTGTLTLQKNGATATGITTLTGSNDAVATFTAADGVYTYTALAGGSFDVTYENAKAKVTVNAYTIATPASIKKSTGIANIEVKCNNETINAATASLECTAKPDVLYANADEYNTAKSLTGDDALTAEQFTNLSKAEKVKTPAVYTVTTNGKAIKFSGASIAGDYEFDYKVGTTVVAHVVVTVTE